MGTGTLLSTYLWIKLALADGIDVAIVKHSLAYRPIFKDPPDIFIVAYVALTTMPSIFLKNRAVNIFGWFVLFGFIVSVIGSKPAWYSVWCMISAISSAVIAFAICKESNHSPSTS